MKIADYDNLLNINTNNTRSWDASTVHYNRLEPTSYRVLNLLFHDFDIQASDAFVDFGCGNGRVLFYVNYRFGLPVTGIELHPITFEELEVNRDNYLKENKKNPDITLLNINAIEYEVQARDSIFYFFNPFSIVIYKKVMTNIIQSLKENPRSIQLIIYYPTPSIIEFLDSHSPFKLLKRIELTWSYDNMDQILIYRN